MSAQAGRGRHDQRLCARNADPVVVNAVNMVFVGASNELGEFRAGAMAALIGTVPAVVFGGVGAVVVAGLWAVLFAQLRRVRGLDARG